MRYSAVLIVLLILLTTSTSAQDYEGDYLEETDSSRFVIGINVSAHFANKNSAKLYTGSPSITRYGLEYIFNLPRNKQAFNDFFKHPHEVVEYPFNPRYQTASEMGLHLGYKLGKTQSNVVFLDFNISQLKFEQSYTIAVYDPLNQIPGPTFEQLPIFGNENRFLLNLGSQVSLYNSEYSNAYFALFGNATNVQMRRNYIVIDNREYEIFHLNELRPSERLGGIGYGGGTGLGFQFYLSHEIKCDIYYNLYYTQTNFSDNFKPYGTHHSIGLRIIWDKAKEEEY